MGVRRCVEVAFPSRWVGFMGFAFRILEFWPPPEGFYLPARKAGVCSMVNRLARAILTQNTHTHHGGQQQQKTQGRTTRTPAVPQAVRYQKRTTRLWRRQRQLQHSGKTGRHTTHVLKYIHTLVQPPMRHSRVISTELSVNPHRGFPLWTK